jgi:hypothetical protein
VGSRGGGGPARKLSSGKEMLWKRRTAASKQDHWAAVECVLRPGGALRVQAGAGNDGKGVAAGGRFENSWHARVRAAGEGNRAGAGGDGRVEVALAGGGAAAAAERQPEAKHSGGRRGNRAGHVLGEEEERGGVQGTCW